MASKVLTFFCFLCAAIVGLATVPTALSKSSGELTVYVVNYPLKYFAERIGGDAVTVVFPAPLDEDPAYWMPDPKTISDYQQADLILLNGANYAKWVNKVTLPRFRLVNTSKSFMDHYIETAEILTHSHGPGGEHAHEALAFTTWLDFSLATRQAREVEKALSRKQPHKRNLFQKNYQALEKDLLALDRDTKEIVSKNPKQALVVSHPVYDYFGHRYGLNLRSVHWEPDEVPTTRQWLNLQDILKDHHAKWMIWEGQPMSTSVAKLKAAGIDCLVFDPCGGVPDQGDFLRVMRQNVENLKRAFP